MKDLAQLKKDMQKQIIFYGHALVPLSKLCSNCYDFNYLCGGPEINGVCPRHYFAQDEDKWYDEYVQMYKMLVRAFNGNPFFAAYCISYTKDELKAHRKRMVSGIQKHQNDAKYCAKIKRMIVDLDKVLATPYEQLQLMSRKYLRSLAEIEDLMSPYFRFPPDNFLDMPTEARRNYMKKVIAEEKESYEY